MKNQILKSIILSSLIPSIITNFSYPVFAQSKSNNSPSSPNFQGLLIDIKKIVMIILMIAINYC